MLELLCGLRIKDEGLLTDLREQAFQPDKKCPCRHASRSAGCHGLGFYPSMNRRDTAHKIVKVGIYESGIFKHLL